MSRYLPYAIIYSSLLVGYGSLSAFSIFLFFGSLKIMSLGLKDSGALSIDAGLSLLFFIQHSVMVRKWVRKRIMNFIPDEYYNAFYAIASGVVLIVVVILWQKTSYPIIVASGIFYWAFRVLFFLSIAGFYWGIRSLGFFDPFGVRRVLDHLRSRKSKPMPFIVKGAYQWVRHPLYFFMLLMIWSCPELTTDRLLFNILWTMWIFIGTIFEERDLIDEFGEKYLVYQSKVPRIIPFKFSHIKNST